MSDLTLHLREPRSFPVCLSIVIPCYNEGPMIPFLRHELTALDGLACNSDVVLVNDGSRDDTLGILAEWAAQDPRIRVLQLSRNFGQDVASTAGLDYCSGDAVVLMDADLQDRLPVIHKMIEQYCAGYDVVYGERAKRVGGSGLLISLGVLGQYVARIYEQAKDRPLYLVSRTYNASCIHGAACDLPAHTEEAAAALQGD